MLNLYVTSTKRKEGKTFVSAGIAATLQSLGYKTAVFKPVQTGAKEINGFMQSPDLAFVSQIDPYINTGFSYMFKSDFEPVIAAENEKLSINIDIVKNEYNRLTSNSECIIADGNGGLLSPLGLNFQNTDLIKRLQTPLLIVTSPSEDSINSTLQAIYTAQAREIEVRGVVINNIDENEDKKMLTTMTRLIEEYSNVKIVGLIPRLNKNYQPQDVVISVLNGIDIESIFKIKIEKLGMD